jgi:CRP/FNR family transcriptional regulator, cyclic AMP receptor protein
MAFGKRRKASDDAAERLSDVEFFSGFSADERRRVAEMADEVEADAGAVLTEQGRPGQECFVILAGSAGVYVSGEFITRLGPGVTVGEMALISNRPRTATVVAETPMKLLSFDTEKFRMLLDEMPKAQRALMALLEDRLRDRNLS